MIPAVLMFRLLWLMALVSFGLFGNVAGVLVGPWPMLNAIGFACALYGAGHNYRWLRLAWAERCIDGR